MKCHFTYTGHHPGPKDNAALGTKATVLSTRLGERVKGWMPFNEWRSFFGDCRFLILIVFSQCCDHLYFSVFFLCVSVFGILIAIVSRVLVQILGYPIPSHPGLFFPICTNFNWIPTWICPKLGQLHPERGLIYSHSPEIFICEMDQIFS